MPRYECFDKSDACATHAAEESTGPPHWPMDEVPDALQPFSFHGFTHQVRTGELLLPNVKCRSLGVAAALCAALFLATPVSAQGQPLAEPAQSTVYGGLITDSNPILPLGSEGPREPASDLSTLAPRIATLSEHGDVTARRTGVTYLSDAATPGVSAAAAPTPTVTVEDCRSRYPNYATATTVVIDHFNYCLVGTCVYYTLDIETGGIVGVTTWRCVAAGRGARANRRINVEVGYDRFVDEGTIGNPLIHLESSLTAGGYNGSDGSNPACTVNASLGNPSVRATWQGGLKATYTVTSNQSDGYSRDDLSRCGIGLYGRSDLPVWAPIFNTGVRMDSATYLGANVNAAIFDRVVPVMQEYSLSSTAHSQVANHIWDALHLPAGTIPHKAGKQIPGSVDSGKPLTRLYDQWDTAASQQKQKNETGKNRACLTLPAPPTGYDCDEFPFASTWEGAGVGDDNFSVRYVDAGENRSAGGTLSAWYGADRILHKDAFYVSIRN
ncbi:NucA/NucB deoxyribonuclease domain-containing protein [Streptomyces sp. NPDC048508]|uniref:NucA/NucB deoxyribonuclease domain-containing protein n=1 Tax=Streptomyces sp. NPDC048508 TaxID=3365561 RepID=UPI0037204504